MGFFNRKKPRSIEIPEIKHEHTWKDMPWYLTFSYNGETQRAEFEVIEPYVCIVCGERKDIQLDSENWSNISYKQYLSILDRLEKKYADYIKPRAVVEDMISDIKYVKDTEHLEMVERLLNTLYRGAGTSSKNKIVSPKQGPVIEVEK